MLFEIVFCLFLSLYPFRFLCLCLFLLLVLCIKLILSFLECVEIEAVSNA